MLHTGLEGHSRDLGRETTSPPAPVSAGRPIPHLPPGPIMGHFRTLDLNSANPAYSAGTWPLGRGLGRARGGAGAAAPGPPLTPCPVLVRFGSCYTPGPGDPVVPPHGADTLQWAVVLEHRKVRMRTWGAWSSAQNHRLKGKTCGTA